MDFIGKQPGKTTLISNGISSIKGNVLKRPDKVALRTENFSETYAEMWQRCIKLANTLLDRGYKKGDLSVTYMSNCYQIVEMMIACEMIGMPLSYGNFRLTPEEIIYQINDCEAKIVFVLQEQYDLIYPLMDRLPTVKDLVLVGESASNDPGVLKFEEMIAAGSPVDPQIEVDPEDIQNLFYTSGTTGKPKGAVRDAYCNYNLSVSTAIELGINREDSLFVAAPMYAAATVGYLYTTLMVGGTVCIAPSFLPEESLRLIDLFKNTFVFMVPIMFDWLFMPPPEVQAKYDLSSVRLAVSCGAPMHTHIFAKMRKGFKNARCINMLGSSELGFVTSISAEEWLDQNKEGSVGKGIFDMDLKVVGENGDELPQGEIGLLYGRSPQTFNGYWNKMEGTQESFLDAQWATVGDMARMDEEGYIYLVDRAKDMIVTGGTNVYPAEVEKVILQMEGIADVGVIGVPDEKWGEQVKAIVVLKPGYQVSEEDIISFCRQSLAGFKTPKSVDYIDIIPRNAAGKMLKKDLRKPYWEGRDTFIS